MLDTFQSADVRGIFSLCLRFKEITRKRLNKFCLIMLFQKACEAVLLRDCLQSVCNFFVLLAPYACIHIFS